MGEFVVSGPWVIGYGVVVYLYVFINLYNKWALSSYVTPYINYEYYEAINYVFFFVGFVWITKYGLHQCNNYNEYYLLLCIALCIYNCRQTFQNYEF